MAGNVAYNKALQKNFADIVGAISAAGPLNVALFLLTNGLITQETLSKVQDLPGTNQSKSTTLVMTVSDQVKIVPGKLKTFVEVLESCIDEASFNKIRSRIEAEIKEKLSTDVPSNGAKNAPPTVPTEAPPTATVPTDVLSEDQLRKVKDKLKGHAAKWELIAQGLGFRAGEIDTIRSMPHLFMGGPVGFLNHMLNEWEQWFPGDDRNSTTCATAGAIIEAVSKAGLGKAAYELKTMLQ